LAVVLVGDWTHQQGLLLLLGKPGLNHCLCTPHQEPFLAGSLCANPM
jgi:hypothetical protein